MDETIIDLTLFPQEMAKHIQEEEELRVRQRSSGQESLRDGTVTLSICCFIIEENKRFGPQTRFPIIPRHDNTL